MEYEKYEYKGKITPLKAQKMLKDEGLNVTLEDATDILKFLANMADVAVRNFLKEKEDTL
ncbi:hypothetical protein [Flavobacterium hibernum]|uniref:Uncharacterized protein n=1 Tax=Flavobacterium hibernum TaxID=37752 RepID=A0A0D0F9C6_9FLAO|nr:hypothetical protein [Flavobacterium hibernum]KIO54602.1 hypothetical protein IW18_00935 [Flavobacterium hibernum]OXA84671.1 hypothetical protein B0A73_18840 [Flavobacterium hibernum]STO18349.1 Uncharacterised protein [Flavobacterium hibernum]